MDDYGHQKTDELLAEMEKRVGSIYKQASEEMREKLAKWYKDFERLDKQKAALVEKGELPKADYLAWRKRKMVESGRLKALVDTLTEDYVNSDKIAMQIVRGNLTDVYALNANYAAYKIEQDANVNLSWTLYDHSTVERLIREDTEILPLPSVNVPLDERWNRQHLNIAITQGILQGESIPHIGDRLQRILGMDRTAAIRSARTATTAAECAGRIDTYKYAESIGIEMQQEWVATLDDRTRHEHRILDGQRVDIGEAFEVDGATIRYPGDPQAPGYLVYNCRCTLVSAVKGIDQSGAARRSKLGNVSYEDWKAGKDQKNVDNSTNSGKIRIDTQFFANRGIAKRTDRQLYKSIGSWAENIKEHEEKLNNPEKYDKEWNEKNDTARAGLLKHWKKEIKGFQENINLAYEELERRKNGGR